MAPARNLAVLSVRGNRLLMGAVADVLTELVPAGPLRYVSEVEIAGFTL